jgi:hypothetical protein
MKKILVILLAIAGIFAGLSASNYINSDYIDAREFGLSPYAEASKNDIAIANAIALSKLTNKSLYIPAGTYNLSTTIDHDCSPTIYGDGPSLTILNNSANVGMARAASAGGLRDLTIVGTQIGYDANGVRATRITYENCHFKGGRSDNASPPTQGYGFYVDAQYIECAWIACLFDQMAWFSGPAFNSNYCKQCRFNGSGYIGGDKMVLYYNQVGRGNSSNFSIQNSVFEVGGIKIEGGDGGIANLSLRDIQFADPGAVGDLALDVHNINGLILDNIHAENFNLRCSGIARAVIATKILCYRIDWNGQHLDCRYLTTQQNADLTSFSLDSCVNHEGTWIMPNVENVSGK